MPEWWPRVYQSLSRVEDKIRFLNKKRQFLQRGLVVQTIREMRVWLEEAEKQIGG